ncbi:MAG: Ig domain-containing protein [Bacteroidales bacterium]|nr:Ig domain-containing protein [Bacteroidales bacterium]
MTVSQPSLSLEEGETATISYTVQPKDATTPDVSFSSSDNSVATVSNTGIVTAVAPGTATITVKTKDGGFTATVTITVKAKTVAVTGISLDKTELTLKSGEKATLTATVTPANATDKSVTWISSDPPVAAIDNGEILAGKPGTATITVKTKDGGKTATCKVTVESGDVAVTGVSLDKTELTLKSGEKATLTATVTPEDATDKTVSWKSSDSAVATVDENGKVTAVKAGSATITVTTTDGGKTATCKVTVTATTVDLKAVYVNSTDYINFSNVLHFKNGSNYRGVVNEFLIVPWNTTLNQLLQDSDESHYTCSSSKTSIAVVKVESLGSRCAFCVKVGTDDPTSISDSFCDMEFTYKGSGTSVTKKVRLVIAPAKAVSAYEYDMFTYNGSFQSTIGDTYAYTLKNASDASFIRLFTEFKGSPSHYAVADKADMASYSWSSSNTSVVYITEKTTEIGDTPYPELSFTGTGTSNVKYTYTDYWGNSLVKNIKFTVSKSFLSGGDFIYKHDNSTSNRHFINVGNSLGVTLMKDESTAYEAGEITGLTWTSSNSAIATVTKSSSNEAGASISGKAPGDATITVTAADGSSRSYFVTVYKGVDKITPNSTTYTLGVGSKHQIKPGKDFTITPSDATYTAENDFKWRSSNTGVLTVSSNGQVTGVSEGTTYVQASPKPLYQWWADARQVKVVMPYLQVINHSGSPESVARLAKEKVNIPADGEILMAPGEVVTIGLFDSKSSRIVIADGKDEGSLVANTSIASIKSIGYNTTTDQSVWISLEGKASGTTELRNCFEIIQKIC